jgi:carboxylate-amine ligase
MSATDGHGFRFGLEVEFLLVEANTYRPLWHPDLSFDDLNSAIETIAFDDLPPLTGLELELPHRKLMPYAVEGYHVPNPELDPTLIHPKGIEIRTPVCASIDECLVCFTTLHERLQATLAEIGFQAVTISHHPTERHFEGPQNKRRHDFWQWAMQAMLTYGPDVNVSLPPAHMAKLDVADLHAKVNYYAPALTALTLAAPIFAGELWRIRGRVGKSIRTYRRSVIAPAIEVHLHEQGRLEFKLFESTSRLADYEAYFLLWLELLIDEGLLGRASETSRIYDLGAIARDGLDVETVRERAAEVLQRAPSTLASIGFDPFPLEPLARRLDSGRLPADEIVEWYREEPSIPQILRRLAGLAPRPQIGSRWGALISS